MRERFTNLRVILALRASRSSVPVLFHCSSLPRPDWPVVCLAIGRTGVSPSVHLYMVITGRLALVLLEVPLSVPPDWPVGAASSSAFYEEGQCVSGPSECSNVIIVVVVVVPISPTYHLFRTFIVHFSDLKG